MNDSTSFGAFCMFHALKLHFTSNYDYFKYNGKTSVTQDSFMRNKTKYSFYKLSRKYGHDDLKNYYISNFVYRDVKWVGDLTGPEAEECYMKWLKIQQSLTYTFRNDVGSVMEDSPDAMLVVTDGQHPKLLQRVMGGDVTIETMAILNDILNFFPMWTRKINDDIIWPEWKRKIEKYIPFIIYDKPKFKIIIKEAVSEYA